MIADGQSPPNGQDGLAQLAPADIGSYDQALAHDSAQLKLAVEALSVALPQESSPVSATEPPAAPVPEPSSDGSAPVKKGHGRNKLPASLPRDTREHLPAEELSDDARKAVRQERSKPILDQFKVWLDEEQRVSASFSARRGWAEVASKWPAGRAPSIPARPC
jgi:hypothetical protein